ncbi:MAG: L-histidine N(alpha)-methyltransferase [Planctomycetota bacterium]
MTRSTPTSTTETDLPLLDCHPTQTDIGQDVARSLAKDPPTISPVYLYDAVGAELFDAICDVDEYYITRTEISILEANLSEIADTIGPNAMVIEPGSGSGAKTDMLLDSLHEPSAYVPIDISRDFLLEAAGRHAEAHPNLEVLPVCADFNTQHPLPKPANSEQRRVVFFPGSTVGNIDREPRLKLLRRFRDMVGDDGAALIGFDLVKEPAVLEAAYNDKAGVTADFNYNLLARLNRELDAGFDIDAWRFLATWNDAEQRIESNLTAQKPQRVNIGSKRFDFAAGDFIRTEHAQKFTLETFEEHATKSGFKLDRVWLDDDELFAVALLTAV